MKKIDVVNKIKLIGISIIYILLVIVVTYLTLLIVPHLNSDAIAVNLLRLFTSPFNAYFEKDYLSNIVLAFVIIGSAEIYLKAIKKPCMYKKALISGILASYILSLSWFLESHPPSAGTSIVASTMLLIAFFYISVGTINAYSKLLRRYSDKLLRNCIYFIIGLILAILIPIFYYGAYIQSNPSWYLHIYGAIVFSAFYILFTRTVSRK